jgi:ribonuclease VapC
MSELITLDSSAIIAILNAEPESDQFVAAVSSAPRIIGAPTVLEVRLWMIRRTPDGRTPFTDQLFGSPDTTIIAFDAAPERIAHDAAARYGVGRHAAGLNFGDCMAYAVARAHDAPLLFKGADFGKTDAPCHPASVQYP